MDCCICCHKEVKAVQTETGALKYKCPRTGMVVISSKKGNRHLTLDVYGPKSKTE